VPEANEEAAALRRDACCECTDGERSAAVVAADGAASRVGMGADSFTDCVAAGDGTGEAVFAD